MAAEQVLTSDLFNSLAKGTRVRVSFAGGMSRVRAVELVVARKSRSKKWGTESWALAQVDENGKARKAIPAIAKIKLVRRDRTGRVSLTLGDMSCEVSAFEIID